jgi:UTP--glucose-1-phosphate uridylyltransferase
LIARAVVPVAGLGARLLPLTRAVPKEMLAIVDRPVVQYVIEELARDGMRSVLLVTGRGKQAIEDHLDLERGGSPEILYTRQPRPLGLGDALRHARSFAGAEAVAVALGDSIIDPPAPGQAGIVSRLAAAYEYSSASAAVAVAEVPHDDVERYGIVTVAGAAETMDVTAVAEKPDPGEVASRLAVAARYVLGPDVFAALERVQPDNRGEVQLTAALSAVIAGGGRVVAVALGRGERRHDVGTVEGYCATFVDHALRDPRFGATLRARAATLVAQDDSS